MTTIEQPDRAPPPNRQGRLQRQASVTGYRVATFSDVLKRHGVTMGCLAALCLVMPGSLSAIATTTLRCAQQPMPYLLAVLGLLVFFVLWSRRRPCSARGQSQWVLYLLFISVTEELTFRLILPALLAVEVSGLAAAIVSNLVFASIHYVTLRWRLASCIATFLGGMGLSQMMTHGDLVLVILVHWLGTFLNTPFPPAERKG